MGHYSYLFIDLAAVVIPLVASFHPRLNFHKTWFAFWPACFAVAALFIVWDEVYTVWRVWGFNPRYLSGVYVGVLPVEEILFFLCIPYASIFSYHCLRILKYRERKNADESVLPKTSLRWSWIFGWTLVTCAALSIPRLYTAVSVGAAGLYVLWLQRRKVPWLRDFYRAYVLILIPFFVVNGVLTGTGLDEAIVWYNPEQMLGLRLGTIPVEDVLYGMLLLLMVCDVYEFLIARRLRQRSLQRS